MGVVPTTLAAGMSVVDDELGAPGTVLAGPGEVGLVVLVGLEPGGGSKPVGPPPSPSEPQPKSQTAPTNAAKIPKRCLATAAQRSAAGSARGTFPHRAAAARAWRQGFTLRRRRAEPTHANFLR